MMMTIGKVMPRKELWTVESGTVRRGPQEVDGEGGRDLKKTGVAGDGEMIEEDSKKKGRNIRQP